MKSALFSSDRIVRNSERVGRVVVRPDHSQTLGLSGNTWFFTGSQFDDLKMSPNKVLL